MSNSCSLHREGNGMPHGAVAGPGGTVDRIDIPDHERHGVAGAVEGVEVLPGQRALFDRAILLVSVVGVRVERADEALDTVTIAGYGELELLHVARGHPVVDAYQV